MSACAFDRALGLKHRPEKFSCSHELRGSNLPHEGKMGSQNTHGLSKVAYRICRGDGREPEGVKTIVEPQFVSPIGRAEEGPVI